MKLSTGIPGLDDVLKGGVNVGSSILVTGVPGTGKTILASHFLYAGCMNNEPGLYISCEENIDSIKANIKTLGIDFDGFEKKNLAFFLKEEISLAQPISIAKPVALIREKKIKRVVLDSLTYFEYASPNNIEFRKSLLELLRVMKQANVTLLVVSQENAPNIDQLAYKPQDFLFDGLILLSKIRKAHTFERAVNVVKMRGQDHLMDIFPFTIDKGGIKVYPKQIPFSLK